MSLDQLHSKGYIVIGNIFTPEEVGLIVEKIAQPPLAILENIFTIRIHLDDTDEKNGALRVVPGSHLNGVQRYSSNEFGMQEEICGVSSGGVMIMRPLLFHASNRSTSANKRRVIHIEFSNFKLPDGLSWAEKVSVG